MSNKFEQLKWDASVEPSGLKKDERTKHLSPSGSSNFSITAAAKDETRTGKRLSSSSWPSLHSEINHETARILSPSLAVMLAERGARCSPFSSWKKTSVFAKRCAWCVYQPTSKLPSRLFPSKSLSLRRRSGWLAASASAGS